MTNFPTRYAVPVNELEPVQNLQGGPRRSRRPVLLIGLVGLGLAASVALAGCTSAPSTTGGGTGGGGQSGSSDGQSQDSTTSESDLAGFEGVPATFPEAEVPIIGGDVPFGVDLGTGWTVIVQVDDTSAAFTDASSRLKGAGFTAVTESTTAEGSFGVFDSTKYQVQVTAADTADYGTCVTYVVVLKG
jgi:hypothetical protein